MKSSIKGVTFLHDETRNKRFVQIDLDTIEKHTERMEDLFDVIIAESRKDEETVSWEDVKKQLRNKKKI